MMTTKTVHLSNLAIPPGELLQEEIYAREISADELADALGVTVSVVAEIFCGERAITPKTASALAEFLEIPASIWLNMEASYRLTLANNYETYGHANPFDCLEREWPEPIRELAGQEGPEAAASISD